jgi:hypothetical protein
MKDLTRSLVSPAEELLQHILRSKKSAIDKHILHVSLTEDKGNKTNVLFHAACLYFSSTAEVISLPNFACTMLYLQVKQEYRCQPISHTGGWIGYLNCFHYNLPSSRFVHENGPQCASS